jgi:hypothetical protein
MVDKNGTTFVFIMVLPKNMHYFSEGKMDIKFLFEKSFEKLHQLKIIVCEMRVFFYCRFASLKFQKATIFCYNTYYC